MPVNASGQGRAFGVAEALRMNICDALASRAVAVFLFTLGLIDVMHWNSDLAQFGRGLIRLFGKTSSPVDLIIAIVELIDSCI